MSDFEFSPENKTGEPSLESQQFAAVLNSFTVLYLYVLLCLAQSSHDAAVALSPPTCLQRGEAFCWKLLSHFGKYRIWLTEGEMGSKEIQHTTSQLLKPNLQTRVLDVEKCQ